VTINKFKSRRTCCVSVAMFGKVHLATGNTPLSPSLSSFTCTRVCTSASESKLRDWRANIVPEAKRNSDLYRDHFDAVRQPGALSYTRLFWLRRDGHHHSVLSGQTRRRIYSQTHVCIVRIQSRPFSRDL